MKWRKSSQCCWTIDCVLALLIRSSYKGRLSTLSAPCQRALLVRRKMSALTIKLPCPTHASDDTVVMAMKLAWHTFPIDKISTMSKKTFQTHACDPWSVQNDLKYVLRVKNEAIRDDGKLFYGTKCALRSKIKMFVMTVDHPTAHSVLNG